MSEPANIRIVLADQPSADLQQLDQLLRKIHFDPQLCTSSEEALSSCLQNPPHLLVCDYSLEPLPGWELLQNLRNNAATRTLPVIFLSKAVDLDVKLQILGLEIDDYITKPYNPEEVAARIETLFQESEVRRQADESPEAGFGGQLQEMSLIDLIQTLELGEKSAVISLRRGRIDGRVFIQQGSVMDAECGDLDGETALEVLLGWLHGHFHLSFLPFQRPRKIQKLNRELSQMGLSMMEHGRRLLQQLPPLHTRLTPEKNIRSNGRSAEENHLLASIQKSMTIEEILIAGEMDELRTMAVLRSLIDKKVLHFDTVQEEEKPLPPIEHDIVERVVRARRRNKNSFSMLASFFKRGRNEKSFDLAVGTEPLKPENGENGRQNPKHLLYLQRSDLLLIRQKLAG
jgi:CheY-like chemotaxis protein